MIPSHDPELKLLRGLLQLLLGESVGSLEKLLNLLHRLAGEAANQRKKAAACISLLTYLLRKLSNFELVDVSDFPILRGWPED